MFLDFLEKREETTDSITLTDEEKIFLKVFGIDSEQPAAAMRERDKSLMESRHKQTVRKHKNRYFTLQYGRYHRVSV